MHAVDEINEILRKFQYGNDNMCQRLKNKSRCIYRYSKARPNLEIWCCSCKEKISWMETKSNEEILRKLVRSVVCGRKVRRIDCISLLIKSGLELTLLEAYSVTPRRLSLSYIFK